MNHQKVYDQIIEKARFSNRAKGGGTYYESHHIIPDFMFTNRSRKGPSGHLPGNPNDPANLVLLTPREHFIAHVLLHHILKTTKYGYSASSALQFFFDRVCNRHPRGKAWNASDSKRYEKYRLLGLEALSNARSGKMPVVDAITRKSIGSVPVDHPKVISGEWIHHSKGKSLSQARRTEISRQTSGSGNPNFKHLTDELIVELFSIVPLVARNNIVNENQYLRAFNEGKPLKKRISSHFFNNKFGGFSNFLRRYNDEHNVTMMRYNRYGLKEKE